MQRTTRSGLRRPTRALLSLALACCAALALLTPVVSAFYVPGAREVSYENGASVPIAVNSLRSSSENFPIDYKSMPFCQPEKLKPKVESIGEIIWGDRQYNSLYSVEMLKEVQCMAVPNCAAEQASKLVIDAKKNKLEKMINKFYRVYMNIDNLPAFTNSSSGAAGMADCLQKLNKDTSAARQRGYPLGIPARCTKKDVGALLNNHLQFTVHYNFNSTSNSGTKTPEYIVVGLEVEAFSIAWPSQEECSSAPDKAGAANFVENHGNLRLSDVLEGKKQLHWTYGYSWVKSEYKWSTRWDWYLVSAAASAASNHILSIVLSIVVVLFVGSSVFCLLLRALHKDFNRYNSEDPEDLQEETGWKLIHADVFRPPFYANWLAIFVANGCQVISTVTVVLLVAMLGFLSPSRRGALVSAVLFTAIFTSVIGGYVCGLLLQYLNCRAWKHIFLCSLTLPGGILFLYLFVSIINTVHGATTAVPFLTLLQIVVLVTMVSLPLTVLGASIAFRQQPITNPVRVGRLAREIPEQSILNKPIFIYSFFPLVPLIVVVIEVYYIMQDLWEGQIYYSFGFLSITALIWAMACALVTISCLYYVLCYENHRWWWVAYLVPGGAGLHMFAVAICFFTSQLSVMSFASGVLFFAYMGVVSYMYGLAAGAIGLITSIFFVRKIYSSIKID